MPRALVVGGTGPTGPHIVEGLVERGYRVTILHRGFHEVEFKHPVEHIHAEPHFREDFARALGSQTFDLVVVTYGRLRVVAEAVIGRTPRLVAVGAPVPSPQEDYPILDGPRHMMGEAGPPKLWQRIAEARELVFQFHRQGHYSVTYFGYPNVYGPRQLAPREWSVVRRLLDGRRTFIMLDGGLTLENRSYVENAAHAVLLGVDKAEESAGQVYNVADEVIPTDRRRLGLIAAAMGLESDIRVVNFPGELGRPSWWWGVGRDIGYAQDNRPPSTHHNIYSIAKMQRELGYRDIVPLEEAYVRTVAWLLANRPEPGGEVERQLGDPFDYQAEDAYIAAHQEFASRLEQIPFAGYEYVHPYSHPKEAWQAGPTATGLQVATSGARKEGHRDH